MCMCFAVNLKVLRSMTWLVINLTSNMRKMEHVYEELVIDSWQDFRDSGIK